MLLCAIADITPGMVLGAQVTDPRSPEHRLLLPGVKLDASLIASMRSRGVTQAWVEYDLTRDLDDAVAAGLTGARLEVYTRLRNDMQSLSRRTLSLSSIQAYRSAVVGMMSEAIASATYASMTDSLMASDGLSTHAANVAYLSLLCGLHLEEYVVNEQPRLVRAQARDMSVVGLAGLLHDIGKSRMAPRERGVYELGQSVVAGDMTGAASAGYPGEYTDHVLTGRAILESANAPARVTHTVLNHHQRYDGTGWPEMTKYSGGRIVGPLKGKSIHICARVVAAANVLDNLMRAAANPASRRPPVAALFDFASPKFDGWFDPVVRRAMLLRIPPFAVGTDVRLSDGRRAVVVSPSGGVAKSDEPCRPVVRVLTNADGKRASEIDTVDLQQHPDIRIVHALGEDVSMYLYSVPQLVAEDSDEKMAEVA